MRTALLPPLDDFRPLPLLSNPHIQTLLGFFLTSGGFPYPTRQHIVPLSDGDSLVLHDSIPTGWELGKPITVVVHGLTGSHRSAQVERLGSELMRQGSRVVRLDQRGAGAGLALARVPYHAGRSDDLRAALAEINRWSPTSPLNLLGVSLGGNVSLKLAGEADEFPVPGLHRVAALGPPIDLGRCAALLSRPSNRLYEKSFLETLIAHAQTRQRVFPDLPPLKFPQRMTMRLFDELYTAPRCGFIDALDYYTRSSSYFALSRIRVKTLIITARDDPFIAVEPFETVKVSENVTIQIVAHGGHLGFVGWDGVGGIRWADRRLVGWLMEA